MKLISYHRTRPGRAAVLLLGLALAHPVHMASAAQDEHEGHDHAAHAEDVRHAEHDEDVEHSGHATHESGLQECDAHAEHDHDAHAEAEAELRLTPEQVSRFGIHVQAAGAGSLRSEISLPGEIVFNQDRVVHMVPRVSGIASEVRKTVGDTVRAGEVMAVIESRELADTKARYLAAKARAALAERTFTRERALREKQVSSEQDYLEAEQSLAEARITLQSAEQQLHALGLSESTVSTLAAEHDTDISRYEIRAPIAGVVTEKHIALGESLDADANIFTVVDLSSVWVNLTVYTKDLDVVRQDQDVTLRLDHNGAQGRGRIAMITPFVEEATRSATARVVLDNHDGRWMPGTFVTGLISSANENLPVVIPRDAVQEIDGRSIVFVEHEGAFEAAPVALGRRDREHVEVLDGLNVGMRYVSKGAFPLKATVVTRNLGSHAGHGH